MPEGHALQTRFVSAAPRVSPVPASPEDATAAEAWLYFPAAHTEHSVCAPLVVVFPAGHSEQIWKPETGSTSWNLPGSHA